MKQNPAVPNLQSRLDAIADWLYEHAPYTEVDQSHLDEGSLEQAYWNFGYMAALSDAIGLLEARHAPPYRIDTSNPYSPNGPDE